MMTSVQNVLWAAWLSWLLAACGGEGDEGRAGMGAGLPQFGQLCDGACADGFYCSNTSAFAGQCTVACTNDVACQTRAANSFCYIAGSQCGQVCTRDEECSMGTTCVELGDKKACRKQ